MRCVGEGGWGGGGGGGGAQGWALHGAAARVCAAPGPSPACLPGASFGSLCNTIPHAGAPAFLSSSYPVRSPTYLTPLITGQAVCREWGSTPLPSTCGRGVDVGSRRGGMGGAAWVGRHGWGRSKPRAAGGAGRETGACAWLPEACPAARSPARRSAVNRTADGSGVPSGCSSAAGGLGTACSHLLAVEDDGVAALGLH